MTARAERLPDDSLAALDRLVEEALAADAEETLPILGFGEISLVLGWPPERPRFACKRLPPFPSRERYDAYERALSDYLAALGAAGVRVAPTEMGAVERADGTVAGYVVQPALPAGRFAPAVLRGADPDASHPIVPAVVAAAADAVSESVGLDSQLANWVWEDGLTYVDVSTPLLWDSDGRSRLDLHLLAQAYPAILRPPLRRFVAPGILDTYRDLRRLCLDLAGNLLKERLDPWLAPFLAEMNARIDRPLTEAEVRRFYRSDARLWAALLRLRRLDRAWRKRIRRRPYPFLLPGEIER